MTVAGSKPKDTIRPTYRIKRLYWFSIKLQQKSYDSVFAKEYSLIAVMLYAYRSNSTEVHT